MTPGPASTFRDAGAGVNLPRRRDRRRLGGKPPGSLEAIGWDLEKVPQEVRKTWHLRSPAWFGLVVGIVVLVIVVGGVLFVLGANPSNAIVREIHDAASTLVGPFKNVFSFRGHPKATLAANWGLAVIVWLVVGHLIASLIARMARAARHPPHPAGPRLTRHHAGGDPGSPPPLLALKRLSWHAVMDVLPRRETADDGTSADVRRTLTSFMLEVRYSRVSSTHEFSSDRPNRFGRAVYSLAGARGPKRARRARHSLPPPRS